MAGISGCCLLIFCLNLFYHSDLTPQFQLSPDEARHAIKALRHDVGDVIHVTDGKGHLATARISQIKKEECTCEVLSQQAYAPREFSIHLAIAPTKNSDRIEWMVEKCVEIGIEQISFITCEHSERRKTNLDRIQKVAISAMKQSQQYWLPRILGDISFAHILKETADQRFIAHVDSDNPTHLMKVASAAKSYVVLVGPEGDFSPTELTNALEAGFKKVSLGPNRLRTETAGLAACHILNLANA